MLDDLFILGVPPVEKIVRTVVRVRGHRGAAAGGGQAPARAAQQFDLVVVLLLSNVVHNAIIGQDDSLLGGLLGVVVLLAVNAVVVHVSAGSERMARLFAGSETVLVRDGGSTSAPCAARACAGATSSPRSAEQGADHLDQVEQAALAPGSSLIVRLRDEDRDASRGDLQRLERRLDQIEAHLTQLLDRR